MMTLREEAKEYLKLRRALGFKLVKEESFLMDFTSYMDRENAPYIKIELALRWAKKPKNALPAYWSTRLSVIRRFSFYVNSKDSHNAVIPDRLLPYSYQRRNPYIYHDDEILKLLQACKSLKYKNGLRKHTYYTLFGLLTVTGLRVSEIISLNRNDIDLTKGILTIRNTKFRKSRLIPVHKSTLQVLRNYSRLRDQMHPKVKEGSFFLSDQGTCLTWDAVRWTFIHLSHQIGLRRPTDSHGPRIHDMRHSFAVKTIIQWYRDGIDVESHIPLLSTYLGHKKPSDTYWYLSAIPKLVGLVGARLEKQLGGLQ